MTEASHRAVSWAGTCETCAGRLPEGARFCPSCGHEVVAERDEERRVVTVLFADLVGYTTLSERLDPEQLKHFLDAAFERLIADIVEFGGSVDKVLGDGILALFGAPVAHEDDAARAVRAAIQMHATLASFTSQWGATSLGAAEPARLRIGVNTGEVVVGRVVGTDNYTALGDVVNVAQRLQSMAPTGGTYVGDATATLAGDAVSLAVVDELRVRGREQPERVWQVVASSVVEQRERAPLRAPLPFVGRSAQRELLASVTALVASGQGAIVAVAGPAGVGKTRLIDEALARFPSDNAVVLRGKCAPYGETNPWAPLAQALVSRLGIEGDVTEPELRERARARSRELFGDGDGLATDLFADAVVKIFGFPSPLDREPPAQAREVVFQAVIESVLNRAALKPVVVWIDDLQWADGAIVEFLRRLSEAAAALPVMIVTAVRDDDEIDWPPADPHPFTLRMPLEPLSRAESDALTAALVDDPSPLLSGELYARSGGNPLFHSQLALLAATAPEQTELPGTMRALIAAQLDQLDPDARAAIDNAAVLGTSGPIYALEGFAHAMGQRFDSDLLDELVEDGLLAADETNWRFRSDVVREVAYRTLTKTNRAERHAAVAAAMQQIGGISIERLAHQVAAAAELAIELGGVSTVPASITAQAETLLFRAARSAIDTGALSHSVRHATRALDLLDRRGANADQELRRELLLLRAEAFAERHEHAAALRDATAALDVAHDAGDAEHEARALRLLGDAAQNDGDLGAARAHLVRSVEIFRSVGNDIELAASLRDLGLLELFGGKIGTADELLAEAEQLSTDHDDRRGAAWARQHRAWVSFVAGDTDEAARRLLAVATEFEELGDRTGVGWATGMLAFVRFQQRRFADAEALAIDTRERAASLGDWWAPAMMDSLVASIRLWSGDFDQAEEKSRKALHVLRSHGDRFGAVMAAAPHARSLVALGHAIDAERSLEELLALAGKGPMGGASAAAAGVAVHLGLGARAVELAEGEVGRLVELGANADEARATFGLALCQVGRADDALAVLVDIVVDSPYSRAVRALSAAMIADRSLAEAEAGTVLGDDTASYLDRAIAYVALASALWRSGRQEQAIAVFESAYQFALDTGGAVVLALVITARSRLSGFVSAHPSISLRPGWQQVIDKLAAA